MYVQSHRPKDQDQSDMMVHRAPVCITFLLEFLRLLPMNKNQDVICFLGSFGVCEFLVFSFSRGLVDINA